MNLSILQPKIGNLPQNPGVYFFRGSKGEILYIGKATNLKSRVQSYFRNVIPNSFRNLEEHSEMPKQVQHDKEKVVDVAGRSEWIGRMIGQVRDIDFQETDSVLEALILESNLIKKHQPKYNTLEKDDKSFSYFVITKEEFPRILILRKTDLEKVEGLKRSDLRKVKNASEVRPRAKLGDIVVAKSYGPYTSKLQMQVALKIMRRIFPFHALKQKTEKGCLDFQIGMCPGPYAGAITKQEYIKNIRGIRMILEGKKKRLVKLLENLMVRYSNNFEFEKAAEVRNKIFALNHIRDVALMTRDYDNFQFPISNFQSNSKLFRIEAYDISNISGQNAVGSMVVFENGAPNKSQYRKFKIKTVEGSNDVAMMKEVLSRRFKNDWAMPDLILLDGGQGHVNAMGELIQNLGLDVLMVAVAKGKTRKNLNFQFPISNKFPMSQFPKELLDFLNDKNKVKSIMDEAHRFAITFHRKLRGKNALV